MGEENHRNLRENHFLFIWNHNVSIKVFVSLRRYILTDLDYLTCLTVFKLTPGFHSHFGIIFLFHEVQLQRGREEFWAFGDAQNEENTKLFHEWQNQWSLVSYRIVFVLLPITPKMCSTSYDSPLGDQQHLLWLVHVNAWADQPALCNQRKCTKGENDFPTVLWGVGADWELFSIQLPVFLRYVSFLLLFYTV